MKTPLILAALLLTPVISRAEEAPAREAFRKQMMERFDADKDGKLSDAEREAAKTALKEKGGEVRGKVLEKFDADKDGKLSETERDAAKAALKARQENKGTAGKKGEKAEGKAEEQRRKLMEQFDEDKDGQLNEAERAKARQARKHRTGV